MESSHSKCLSTQMYNTVHLSMENDICSDLPRVVFSKLQLLSGPCLTTSLVRERPGTQPQRPTTRTIIVDKEKQNVSKRLIPEQQGHQFRVYLMWKESFTKKYWNSLWFMVLNWNMKEGWITGHRGCIPLIKTGQILLKPCPSFPGKRIHNDDKYSQSKLCNNQLE